MKLINKTIYGLLSLVAIQESYANCNLFEHPWGGEVTHAYNGTSENRFPVKWEHLEDWRLFKYLDNKTSMVHVARGCTLTVFEHNDFKGDFLEFYASAVSQKSYEEFNMYNYNFNDKTSSYKCSCNPQNNDVLYSSNVRYGHIN